MPKNAHTHEWYCILNQGYTFDENRRIDSCSDSCIIQIWQSISLIELCSRPKCSSFSEIWLSRTETKVSPRISSVSRYLKKKKKKKLFFLFFLFLKINLPTPSIFMPKKITAKFGNFSECGWSARKFALLCKIWYGSGKGIIGYGLRKKGGGYWV